MNEEEGPDGPRWNPPIEVQRQPTCTVVRVAGGLDAATAPVLGRCLAGLVDGGTSELVVDLERVPFCDDAGLGVLVGVHRRLDQCGGHLRVDEPAPQVRHTLVEHGLDRVFDIR